MSGTFLGTGLGGGFFPAAAAASPVTPPAPTSEAVAIGGSVTGWTFSAFTDPDSRIASYSATLTAVVGSGSLSGSGLGPYSLTGTADGDSYTVELDALDGDGAVLATATHSVNIGSAGIVTGSFVGSGWIELDGVDEYVDFGNIPAVEFDYTDAFTFSCVASRTNVGASFMGVSTVAAGDNEININFASSTNFVINIKLGGQRQFKTKNGALSGRQHLMMVGDGTNLRGWIDGVEITSWNFISGSYPTTPATWDGTAIFAVGARLQGVSDVMAGTIEQVAVWSSDQSANAATISSGSLANDDLRNLATPPDVIYVPFKVYGDSETTASGISDLSGNNYDGSGVNLDGDELQAYIGDSA